MTTYPIRSRRWTREEYDRLGRLGVLSEDEPIELLAGQLVVAEPKGTPHSTAVALVAQALARAFGDGWLVRIQDPIALDEESEPEPDVAVVPGTARDYLRAHPARAALLVEVAETSLVFDRRYKGSLYARAGVSDYWIVNLADDVIEVRRRPVADAEAEFGVAYAELTLARRGDAVVPLARPDVRVAADDLLP
jgi:Uma2 family endonuclease